MNRKDQKHLNSPQVYRTKILIEVLKKFPSVHRDTLIREIRIHETTSISLRTLQRYVKTLNEKFGLAIKLDRSINHYFLDENRSVNIDSFLSHIEILSMATLINTPLSETNSALAFIEFESKSTISSIPNFKFILEAIYQALPIIFSHYSFYHLKQETYTLKPYFLKQYQNR